MGLSEDEVTGALMDAGPRQSAVMAVMGMAMMVADQAKNAEDYQSVVDGIVAALAMLGVGPHEMRSATKTLIAMKQINDREEPT